MAYEKNGKALHQPVLEKEVIVYLAPERGGWYLDCTLGGGGHTGAIASRLGERGSILALDIDRKLVDAGTEAFKMEKNVIVRWGNYRDSGKIMHEMGIDGFDGILLDLGFSSFHVDCAKRGFSFREDEELDMRYDPDGGDIPAGEVLSRFSQEDICDILIRFGEERQAKKIAAAIVSRRKRGEIVTSGMLKTVVVAAKGTRGKKGRTDAATKTFQALRIFVNRELENLEEFLLELPGMLNDGGRVAIISYHSLEDRLVKRYYKKYSGKCVCPPGLPACACGRKRLLRVLTPRPLRPTDEEISLNRRARSAKMRVAQKEEGPR